MNAQGLNEWIKKSSMHSNYPIWNCCFKLFIMPTSNSNFKVELFKKIPSVQKCQEKKLSEIQQAMAKHCIRSCVVHKYMLEKVPLLKNVPLNEKDTQLVSSKKKKKDRL